MSNALRKLETRLKLQYQKMRTRALQGTKSRGSADSRRRRKSEGQLDQKEAMRMAIAALKKMKPKEKSTPRSRSQQNPRSESSESDTKKRLKPLIARKTTVSAPKSKPLDAKPPSARPSETDKTSPASARQPAPAPSAAAPTLATTELLGRKRPRDLAKNHYPEMKYERNPFNYQVEEYIPEPPDPEPEFAPGPVTDVETRKRIHAANYHLRQNQTDHLSVRARVRRTLARGAKRRQYHRRKAEYKSVNHWAQRLVLLQQIEFLTEHSCKGDLVVCVGAAPGIHVYFLKALFPWARFVLYDEEEFQIEDNPEEEIRVFQRGMPNSQEIEALYAPAHRRTLLIVDRRSRGFVSGHNKMDAEKAAEADMAAQWELYTAMQPRQALLRFTLPYKKGSTKYLDGQVCLPVWGNATTTEVRLVPNGRSLRDWDHKAFEEQMFHFNTVTRVQYYQHSIRGVRGLCHCYDCASEVSILTEYLKKFYDCWNAQYSYYELHIEEEPEPLDGEPSAELIEEKMPLFMKQINRVCGGSSKKQREFYWNPPPANIRWRRFIGVPGSLTSRLPLAGGNVRASVAAGAGSKDGPRPAKRARPDSAAS